MPWRSTATHVSRLEARVESALPGARISTRKASHAGRRVWGFGWRGREDIAGAGPWFTSLEDLFVVSWSSLVGFEEERRLSGVEGSGVLLERAFVSPKTFPLSCLSVPRSVGSSDPAR